MSTADPAPTSGAPTTSTPTPGATPPAEPGAPAPTSGPDDRRFTQADLDRTIGERLAREREKYGNYDELKAAADELAQIKASQLSETERLQQQTADAEARAAAAEARAAAAEQAANDRLKAAEVVGAAARLGAADPRVVARLVSMDEVTVGDDGQVTGAEEAVKAILEASPFLVGKTPPPTPGAAEGGVRGTSTPTTFTREQLRDPEFFEAHKDEIMRAAREGRIST